MAPKKFVEPPACNPAPYELPDIAAMQALAAGAADSDQQKRALDWVINHAAGTYDLEYRSDARDHAFVSGRRFVGLQIVKMLKLNLMKFKENKQS
jgi:hypothetical protein